MKRTNRRERWVEAALAGILLTLLALGLAKLAVDARAVALVVPSVGASSSRQEDPGDGCGEGLVPVGGTGLCTHGPDPAPPGLDVEDDVDVAEDGSGGFSAAGATPPIACDGNGTSGNRVEVLYARASNVPSRFSAVRATLQDIAARANEIYENSAAETGGSRSIRFVHSPTSGGRCTVSVREVVMPPAGDNTFEDTVVELRALGFTRTDRAYLVLVDANELCGVGTIEQDPRRDARNGNNVGPSYSRVDAGCWTGLTAAHELGHNLGAVQYSAPNSSRGGHCVDEYDVMCYRDAPFYPAMRVECTPTSTYEFLLDCNHDDYFHTAPPPVSYLDTYWNVASSRFLIGAQDRPPLPPPVNDDFEDALRTAGRPFTDAQAVLNATAPASDPGASCRGPFQREGSVWYVTRPAAGGTVAVDTAGSNYDTNLSVYAATAGGLVEVACAGINSPEDRQARTSFAAMAGTTYYVMVTAAYTEPGLLRIRLDGPLEAVPPAVVLSKDKSKFNGEVVATLTGFAPNSSVTLRWPRDYSNDPDVAASDDLLTSGQTDGVGRATLRFKTPLEPYGDYAVTARDRSGGKATATLRVIPRILLNEEEGTTVTTLRVYFYGFAPGERIEVRWHNGSTSATGYRTLFTLTVAVNGRAVTRAFTPPPGAVGDHLVVGKVVGVSRSASTTFELLAGGALIKDATATAEPTATTAPTSTVESSATPTSTPTIEPTSTVTLQPTPELTSTPTTTSVPDATPVAVAGEDRSVFDGDRSGDEAVPLDGSESFDPDGGLLTYAWTVDGTVVAAEAAPELTLPGGETTVTLTVVNEAGLTSTDDVLVSVASADGGEE